MNRARRGRREPKHDFERRSKYPEIFTAFGFPNDHPIGS
jgi:hypothetical protein